MTTLEEFLASYSRLIKKRAAMAARQLARDAMWTYDDLHQQALFHLARKFDRVDFTKDRGQLTQWVDVSLRQHFLDLIRKVRDRERIAAKTDPGVFEQDAVCRRAARADFVADLRATLAQVRDECSFIEAKILDYWLEHGPCRDVGHLLDAIDLSFWGSKTWARGVLRDGVASVEARLTRAVKDDPYLPMGLEDCFDDTQTYTG